MTQHCSSECTHSTPKDDRHVISIARMPFYHYYSDLVLPGTAQVRHGFPESARKIMVTHSLSNQLERSFSCSQNHVLSYVLQTKGKGKLS